MILCKIIKNIKTLPLLSCTTHLFIVMRLRLHSNAIQPCSNASISSSHVNGCEVVVFVCCEASIATPQRRTKLIKVFLLMFVFYYLSIRKVFFLYLFFNFNCKSEYFTNFLFNFVKINYFNFEMTQYCEFSYFIIGVFFYSKRR